MPRPIDKNLLADMFARAAELKTTRSPDGRAAGRVLLSSIFARARELQVRPGVPAPEEDTAPMNRARDAGDQVARGWNEEADQRARAPEGVDPDDLLRTRHLDRESAVEEFRSSLEALFSESDSDEQMLIATDAAAVAAWPAPSAGAPSDGQAARGSKLFTAAAEELFGMAMEDLEELVLEAWERRMRGEPAPAPAPRGAPSPPAYAAGPTASPALASLEDGELLLTPKKKDLSSSDVDHILTDFAFDGGNPVPAAEVVRRAKEQVQAPPSPQPLQPQPPPPQAVRTSVVAPREDAAATLFDPFARPLPLPSSPRSPAAAPVADAFAAPPRGGDAFAPPGLDAYGRPRAPGQTPPPTWRVGSGPQPALPAPGPTWRVGSGQQPALPGGWQPQPPQAPQPQPPPHVPTPHVPASWPFVEDPPPAPPPQRSPAGRLEPPVRQAPGRHGKPGAPGQAPPPQGEKPRSPPSGEGFDPFAPSWWDERSSDGDVKL